jgi:hypothetical protein
MKIKLKNNRQSYKYKKKIFYYIILYCSIEFFNLYTLLYSYVFSCASFFSKYVAP